jgi:hypothetical protein
MEFPLDHCQQASVRPAVTFKRNLKNGDRPDGEFHAPDEDGPENPIL